MSYAWTGAPASFNGTDPSTGGDSSKCRTKPKVTAHLGAICQCPYNFGAMTNRLFPNSHHKPEPMVPIWRPSLHHCRIMHGATHDSGPRISLLWSCTTKVRPLNDLGMYGFFLSHCLPVVLLGIFSGFQ